MSAPVSLFIEDLIAEHGDLLAAHRDLMERFESVANAARTVGDTHTLKHVERATEFARLLGVRLATIGREIARAP